MLSVAHQVMLMVGAATGGGGEGLPGFVPGDPFGFQVPVPTPEDRQNFEFAAWIVYLPLISAALCGLFAAFRVKSRIPAWTTVLALAGSCVLSVIMVSRLDPMNAAPVVVHLFDWIDLSWGTASVQQGLHAKFAL